MSDMRKKIQDLLYEVHDGSVGEDRAILNIKTILLEEMPNKATPLCKTRPLSKRNVGWNEAIDFFTSKLESLEGPSRTAGKSTENRGQND